MNQYPGWWSSESSLELAAQLLAESDFDTRMPICEKIQDSAYTEIPAIKIGDSSTAPSAPTRSAAGIRSSSAVSCSGISG